MEEHRITLRGSASEALEAAAEAAEIWGGEWQHRSSGGTLTLPYSVGVRRGEMEGDVSSRESGDGAELLFRIERRRSRVHVAAVAVLLFGAAGGLILTAWPFYPVLIPLTPVGVLLSLAAWFLVVSRVKTRAEREFFELVEEILAGEEPPYEPPD